MTVQELRGLAIKTRFAVRRGFGDSESERLLAELVPMFGELADRIARVLDKDGQ